MVKRAHFFTHEKSELKSLHVGHMRVEVRAFIRVGPTRMFDMTEYCTFLNQFCACAVSFQKRYQFGLEIERVSAWIEFRQYGAPYLCDYGTTIEGGRHP